MELDLNSRNAKWNREQNKRRDQAKRKIETERRKRLAAAKAHEELEAQQAQKRIERLEEQERQQQQALEEQRLTGGIRYLQSLRPVPTAGDGDKITLPVSALEELNPQNALELGVFTFELSFEHDREKEDGERRTTHAGVLEFVADEGTVGLPPKVAASLFQHTKQLPETVRVRFVRLEKGKFASLQPRGDGFGDRQIDFKHMLERSLKTHTTLTVGDVLFVRHGRETFEVVVKELKPEPAVNILNTDLEVDITPSEAVAQEKEAAKRLEEEAARAVALAQEKEQRKADKLAQLAPEPSGDERMQVKVILRMPGGTQATRRFLHSSLLHNVFEFIEALTGDDANQFQVAATYPRRVFGVDAGSKSLQELGLNGRQEALFVEKHAADEIKTEPVMVEDSIRAVEARPRTRLPGAWEEARQTLEKTLDETLHSTAVPAIHAMEPTMPVAQSTDGETKWQAQLSELEGMGFMNRALNIEVLERYQGRLLRVVNFLSEMSAAAAADSNDNGVTVMEE
ncbi:Ubiquitin fusion degradation protein UFD1 [Phytophthora boehmeriae]|uniref:Ubiquitin fusion degradation protein UFD1 n=1 Tax=Phytophthora boehmeriae TaxID=109152 RepID=A0A8T1X2J1_9STRA|nr:Ubiquitin fusion degradation protein UFD1 [Phytophthora boehmeriae]